MVDKLSNYKKIINSLSRRKSKLTENEYAGLLGQLKIIEIQPVNESTVKVFEGYANLELTDSNTCLLMHKIDMYNPKKVYGDFFRRAIPGTEEYRHIAKAVSLFCNEEIFISSYNTDILDLIKMKQDELRDDLFKNIKELICESTHHPGINYFDSIQDTDMVLFTISSIVGAYTKAGIVFELGLILGREITKYEDYRFTMEDIKLICEYFDIDYESIDELYERVR